MHFSVLSISRNRWSTYVKRCHEMIAFLTASTLAFQHVRYLIDAQRKCGSLIHLEDYISHCKVPWRQHYHGWSFTIPGIGIHSVLHRCFRFFIPFQSTYRWAGIYYSWVRYGLFGDILYITNNLFICLGFGFFIGAITIREFWLARRDSWGENDTNKGSYYLTPTRTKRLEYIFLLLLHISIIWLIHGDMFLF